MSRGVILLIVEEVTRDLSDAALLTMAEYSYDPERIFLLSRIVSRIMAGEMSLIGTPLTTRLPAQEPTP